MSGLALASPVLVTVTDGTSLERSGSAAVAAVTQDAITQQAIKICFMIRPLSRKDPKSSCHNSVLPSTAVKLCFPLNQVQAD
jgi:hypothetical protein